jgi:hypothetical protein
VDCSVQRERFEAFRAKPFSVERDLTLRIDGGIRGHEVARLSWDGKKLSKIVLAKEPEKAVMEVSGDPTLSSRFACEGWKETDGGGLEFRSPGGAALAFRVDAGGALVPIGWEEADTVKVLFVRKRIIATATFTKFARP